MTQRNLRQKPRISYFEPEEPDLDEYVFCEKCGDYVYEYCSIHGPLLVIPDDKIYDKERKPLHCVDAADANKSNWMRYVNCARHWREQNLVAYQYQGELYYRTIKIIRRFTELLVFYGSEFACELDVDLGNYNSPPGYAQKYGAPVAKKRKPTDEKTLGQDIQTASDTAASNVPTTILTTEGTIVKDLTTEAQNEQVILTSKTDEHSEVTTNADNKKTIKFAVPKKIQTKDKKASRNTRTVKALTKIGETTTVIQSTRDVKISESKRNNLGGDETKASHGPNNTTDLYIYCNDCNNKFISKHELLKHLRFHDPKRAYACEVCKLRYDLLHILKKHMRTHTGEKPYACEICDKTFSRTGHLKRHMRTHTGEKPYACEICDKTFNETSYLKSHMRTHTGEKPYACEICDKTFNETSSLKRHMRTHTGEKPYACEICDETFNQTSNLKRHMRTHTGEKPYACEICDKTFSETSTLKKHMRTHTGEKPYVCEICDKTFSETSTLKKHMRTHTGEKPYACKICDKTFNERSNLKRHMRTHTGEKPYACEICDKKCIQKGDLKSHTRTHTGEKPYACEICETTFAHSSTLKIHITKIHLGK